MLMQTNQYKEWKGLVDEWRKKYPKQTKAFDPSAISIFYECESCGKTKDQIEIQRHHRGNDFFFAKLYPETFAERYIQFHPEDCSPLCQPCHKNCTQTAYAQVWTSILVKLNGRKPSIDGCRRFRVRMVKAYYRWLGRKRAKIERKNKRMVRNRQNRKRI